MIRRSYKDFLLLSLVFSIIFVTACSNDEESTGGEEGTGDEETITLSFANELPGEHPWGQGAAEFKEIVEEETEGAIQIEVHNGGSLGGSGAEIQEGTALGTIDIGISSTPLAQILPEFEILSLPYLFKDREDAWEVVDSDIGTDIANNLNDENLQHLAYWEDGYRQVTNSVRQIQSPEDFEGLRIRVPESNLRIDTFEELGASPLPMSFSEVFTAMQQGTIDGQENPLAVIENSSFYDVQEYLTITNHVYSPASLFINQDIWSDLSEEHQDIILEAAKEGRDLNRELNEKEDQELISTLEERGMEVYELDENEMQEFQDVTLPVYEGLIEKLGGDSEEIINSILDRN